MNLYIHVTDGEKVEEVQNMEKCLKSSKIGTRIGIRRNIEITQSAYFKAFSRRYIEI